MNQTFARIACALALSSTVGCADIYFTEAVPNAILIEISDIGSECETDDPADTEMARVHVEQQGDTCVITAELLWPVPAIDYQDLVDSFEDIAIEEAIWMAGGICFDDAQPGDGTTPNEKCDYKPSVTAMWRPVGETTWLANPELPPKATAELALAFHPAPLTSLDDVDVRDPGIEYSTSGANFPSGPLVYDHDEVFLAFTEAEPEDLLSVAYAQVEVPMADIADFTAHEYQVEFRYQIYVQGLIENTPIFAEFWEWLIHGGEE